jgi:hypothetical protein
MELLRGRSTGSKEGWIDPSTILSFYPGVSEPVESPVKSEFGARQSITLRFDETL